MLKDLDAYAEIAQIADTVNAYYEFLQQLAALPKTMSRIEKTPASIAEFAD